MNDDLASPACFARDIDAAYAGYATREEILAVLNQLLEAERAGARIAALTAAETSDAELKALMVDIGQHEVKWCAMLMRRIAELDAEPSPRIGGFYEKCLAIGDLRDRIAFINRGQEWIVRKLGEMLPKIRDDALHADLIAMLGCHEANIARVTESLKTKPTQRE